MGLMDRVRGWLSRGEPRAVDPDELVEVALVRLPRGPMLVAALQDAGIEAQGIETFNVVSDVRSDMRILVHRRDVDAARLVLQRLD